MHLQGGQQIQQDREGQARHGHPRANGENGVTPGRGQPPMATEGWPPTAGPSARVGEHLREHHGHQWDQQDRGDQLHPGKGEENQKGGGQGCGEEVAVGTRMHPTLAQHPARGQPYLVTRSTSRAGGADGAGQTSETVFARSAISTFGTGVALGEEDEGGLPGEVPSRGVTSPFAQQHQGTPRSSSSLGEAGTILLFPGSGGRAGLGSQLAAGDCPQGPRSDGDRGSPEHPLPWAPASPSPGGCCP